MKNNSTIARRKLLKLGAFALGTGVVPKVTDSQANPGPQTKTIIAFKKLGKDATPERVLEALLVGNKQFVENKPEAPNQDWVRLKEVSTGQKPLVSIMSCSDSRVPLSIRL